MPLFTTAQLKALAKVATAAMTDSVTITRPTLSDSVYGDDESLIYTTIGSSKAWFRSTPTPVATADVGQVVTVNTYRLLVPPLTDIKPKDQVVVGTDTYLVTDTTSESTYLPYLQVSLRRRE